MHPLFRRPCNFTAGAANMEALPGMTHPEVAFIGRSNVGKSSLVNALVGQNALARTSQNPGATKQLNFFLLADQLMMVDMPGYGYAKVGHAQLRAWDLLVKGYLTGRANLKRAFVLIDARRGVMQSDDDFMTLLDESAVGFQIVLTKCDSIKQAELDSVLQNTQKTITSHVAAHPELIATSAVDKRGIEALQQVLIGFIA